MKRIEEGEQSSATLSHAQGGFPAYSTNAPSKGGGTMANDIAGVPRRLLTNKGAWLPNGSKVRVSAGTELVKISDTVWVAYSKGPADSPLARGD